MVVFLVVFSWQNFNIRKCVISSNHYKNQNPPVLVTSRSCADLEVRSRQVMRIDKISPNEVNFMVIQKQSPCIILTDVRVQNQLMLTSLRLVEIELNQQTCQDTSPRRLIVNPLNEVTDSEVETKPISITVTKLMHINQDQFYDVFKIVKH